MMKFRFQSFFDIATSASSMQVIQWSVGGKNVIDRCAHLFGAYKYFKLGKISVKMVPASTLPVDPLGLSYDSDDPQTVDPRDQMNPGLVRITNGEDVFTNVSALTSDQQEQAYNAMMLDPRWSKFMLQSGFRRSAYPLYWQIGQLSQDKFPGAIVNVPQYSNYGNPATPQFDGVGALANRLDKDNTVQNLRALPNVSSARGLFQVGHRGKLGFLPTDYYQEMYIPGSSDPVRTAGLNNVPEVSVITCVLPKAYKTLYYYRVFVTEEVIFAGLRSAPMPYDSSGVGHLAAGIDQFAIGIPQVYSAVGNGPVAPSDNSLSYSGRMVKNIHNDGGDLP